MKIDFTPYFKKYEEIGAAALAEGIKFGYHNHHFEFQKYNFESGRKTALAELYESTDPDKLFAEIDVHWVARGGEDPVKWIRKVNGRMPVIHFKDFAMIGAEPHFCEIGEGNLNWPEIIKACEDTGVRWYSIEQDNKFEDKDIFDSMEISFNNLVKMGVE